MLSFVIMPSPVSADDNQRNSENSWELWCGEQAGVCILDGGSRMVGGGRDFARKRTGVRDTTTLRTDDFKCKDARGDE